MPPPASNDPPKRAFTQEEVNAILSRAVERQSPGGGSLTRAEIVDAAREAGISTEAIDEAILEVEEGRPAVVEEERVQQLLASRRWGAWRAFSIHFTVYVMTAVFLGFVNSQSGGPPWCLFPILGWGIGIAAHFMSILFSFVFPDPRRAERIRDQLRKSDARNERREKKDEKRGQARQRREAKEAPGPLVESAKELGVAVQRGMATVLADVAKTIHEEVDRSERDNRKRAPGAGAVRVGAETRGREEDELDAFDEERDTRGEGERRSGRR